MTAFLYFIDRLSMFTGKAFAWCILVLTFGGCYEVFMRYVVNDPTGWSYDMSYIMYGTIFLMAGPYALSRNGHVRGDVVYRLLPWRVQAGIDLTLHIVFLLPGISAMIYQGTQFAAESWRYGETSIFSPADIPVYPLKTLIPVCGVLLLLQGFAECVRCIRCLRDGRWPAQIADVEETETTLISQYEHTEAPASERQGAAR